MKMEMNFNFALQYAINKVHETEVVHRLLVYADNVNPLGDNIGAIKRIQTL
jgi:hypothetical protein